MKQSSSAVAVVDPVWAEEVQEWLDALAAVLRFQGDERAGELLRRLQQFASQAGHDQPRL